MKNTLIDIVVVLTIPVVLAIGYYAYQSEAGDTSSDDSSALAEQTKRVSDDLNNLNSISFDPAVLANMKYLKTERFVGEDIGRGVFRPRANPFMHQ